MLEEAGVRYEDLVAAADVVVSKPGYGIVSECIANQTALLYTSRGVFAENDVLIAGMQRVLRSRFISQDDLRSGRWQPSIRALLAATRAARTHADRWCQRRRGGNPCDSIPVGPRSSDPSLGEPEGSGPLPMQL